MKQSNNYFQKIALALVASILVLIPNLNVYSSVGSYRTSSPGISANNHFLLSDENDPPNVSIAPIAAIAIVAASLASAAVAGLLVSIAVKGKGPEFYPKNKIINPNYKKYDFSEFDN